jgi:hypothetical protein
MSSKHSKEDSFVRLYSQFKQKGTPEKMNMVKKGLFAILPESYLHTFTLSEIPVSLIKSFMG